jgi:hypothetical protein
MAELRWSGVVLSHGDNEWARAMMATLRRAAIVGRGGGKANGTSLSSRMLGEFGLPGALPTLHSE